MAGFEPDVRPLCYHVSIAKERTRPLPTDNGLLKLHALEKDAKVTTAGTTVLKLAVPLTQAQVEAANQLYQRYLVDWQQHDLG